MGEAFLDFLARRVWCPDCLRLRVSLGHNLFCRGRYE